MKASYGRFAAMIATSTVVMFLLMYSTEYRWSDVWWSQTRTWMALFMGAMMAVIMLGFMLDMYTDKKTNLAIFAGSAVVFAAALFFARSQATVGDVDWMRAMIPHHSIAILTSSRAQIRDPRVRRLADDIILAQKREIAEMEALIHDLDGSDFDGPVLEPGATPVVGGSEEATGPVGGAPALTVGPLTGDVLMLTDVKVVSDAWIAVHPQAVDGSVDVSRVLGRAFAQHGTSDRIPLTLDGAAPGATLVAMLHDDTGDIGRFEFTGAGSPDQPLTSGGRPVFQPFVAR